MKTMLDDIVRHKRVEVRQRKERLPFDQLEKQCTPCSDRFVRALQRDGINVIAEIKPRSPSAGELFLQADAIELARLFSRYACAISVLTDANFFGGSLELLAAVCKHASVPVLCKEFILDPYQVCEARHAGAEAVLLIVKIVDDKTLGALVQKAKALGMAAVVEVQAEEELNRALNVVPDVVLINNRNLQTFEIDMTTTSRLAPLVPSNIPVISASGVETRNDVELLSPYAHNFLVGSALMKAARNSNGATHGVVPREDGSADINPAIEDKLRELCAR